MLVNVILAALATPLVAFSAISRYNPDDRPFELHARLTKVTATENADGSCYAHTMATNENCQFLMEKFSITQNDLYSFNKNTFGWMGCGTGYPLKGDKVCVSTGTPPKPAVNNNAECGPQAPGSLYNSKCPLNACCSQYGYCGVSSAFCLVTKSPTGAPGTTLCLSNCGYGLLPNKPVATFKNVGYWMNSGGSLAMDPSKLAQYNFDIVHYGFIPVSAAFVVDSGSTFNTKFSSIKSKKVASFGGAGGSSYFSSGATATNRKKLATNIVQFLAAHNLDGIDLDWEYPTSSTDGNNYLALVQLIKSLLPSGKTLSVTLPASYASLKYYPVSSMQNYVDYFVYMTYDLHGQWDYSTGEGVQCHTNKTAVNDSLLMLAKAGVTMSKVYGGLVNYGRSYQLSSAKCTAVGCPFTGPNSGAKAGPITNTPGILSEPEINAIASSTRKNKRSTDSKAQCDIMVFDNTQWVAWPKAGERTTMQLYFKASGLGGSALWLSNYYNT
ncbi:uncharacterized protein PRCAT00002022001 [Priceomyces carsonii]|uniref:uncharacterized protein n=1 Tax=Priceomyces carsonii TaxID=28549 RepID=UPI002ED9966B|nr:unnamed protein product [Priceomyces carsonii]